MCSAAARQRGDQLAGSAGTARSWLLIEHPGPWAPPAQNSPPFDDGVGERLWAQAARRRMRVLLVRRHGRTRRESARRLAVFDQAGAAQWWGEWSTPEQVGEVLATALAGQLSLTSGPPALLACTHGRHDRCCAVHGRAVAGALAQRWPENVWECSHLGGDRFAGNVLVLPDEAMYGGLDADAAADCLTQHLSGGADLGHLRGICGQPPAGQVAAIEAMRAYRVGPGHITVESVAATGPRTWRVRLRGHGRLPNALVAEVRSVPREAELLTCKAVHRSTPNEFAVVALRSVDA